MNSESSLPALLPSVGLWGNKENSAAWPTVSNIYCKLLSGVISRTSCVNNGNKEITYCSLGTSFDTQECQNNTLSSRK